jgi:hypothetical protein
MYCFVLRGFCRTSLHTRDGNKLTVGFSSWHPSCILSHHPWCHRYWGPDVGGVNGELACGKTTTWEGGFRVPTIVHWPGVVNPGTVNQELTSSLDWFPTLSHIVGIPLKPGVVR